MKTSVQRAIQENDARRLSKLLSQRAKLHLTGEDVALALMEAVSQGKAECVTALLGAKADPNCMDEDGKTPLILCMDSKAGGNPVIIRDLLKAGGSPNKATLTNKQTALHLASRKGYQVTVKVLLGHGAQPDKRDAAGNTALMYAAKEGHFTALNMLLESGAAADSTNKNVETALMFAAKAGHVDIAVELLECGANPNHRDQKGQTALMLALKEAHMDMVEQIMSYDCDVNVQSEDSGKTILHWAVQHGDVKLVQSLLRLGAEPNIRDKDWETPFITALLTKRMDILGLLIKYRCNITVTDKHFNTGLHIAAREGLLNLIPMFLDSGLDCNLKTSAGQTPLMLAAAGGHVGIVELLLSKGANPEAMDRHRATPLVYAIMSKAADKVVQNVTKLLIRTGCDLNQGTSLLNFLKDNRLDRNKHIANIEQRPYSTIEIAFLRGRAIVFLMLLKSGCSLKDLNIDVLKHGKDWLSPKRTDFSTVLYLLKHVKTRKKSFPTLYELCRRPASRTFRNPIYKSHVDALNPSKDIVSYLQINELDELEKNFQEMLAKAPGKSASDRIRDATRAERGSEGSSPFSRLSHLRATYTLGTRRRQTTSNASDHSTVSSGSGDDDVFGKSQVVNGKPKLGNFLLNKGHPRSKTVDNKEVVARTNGDSTSSRGIEHWLRSQNRGFDSPRLTRKSSQNPSKIRSRGLNSPKTPKSITDMLFPSSPDKNKQTDDELGDQSVVSTDTGFQSVEDTPARSESPTERALQDMKSAAMWQSYTSPFDSWDNESFESASIAGSQDSRETDLSDWSRSSNHSNSVAGTPRTSRFARPPSTPGTPTAGRRSGIPTFRRQTPKSSSTRLS